MKGNAPRVARLGTALLGLAALAWVLVGKAAQPDQQGLPTDWSHQHVIFSQPATDEQAANIAQDPRYWQQWYRQNIARVMPGGSADTAETDFGQPGRFDPRRFGSSQGIQGDWSQDLGSGANAGAGVFPAKFAFQPGVASCSDYVVFSTGPALSSSQATIVAYNNLYSGCSGLGSVPTLYWAYNTGGPIYTSPAISGDGTQIAFAQSTAGSSGLGSVVLLKFAAGGTVSSPAAITTVSRGSYRTCTAPCMTEVPLVSGVNGTGPQVDDRTSSVFPDYQGDTIWVGGALGWLHRITGVFRGNPAEEITSGYPVQVSGAISLSSPVYDRTGASVYVGDHSGFLYRISNLASPTVAATVQLDHGVGIVAGPIIDSTQEKLYVFASSDGTTKCAAGTLPCAGVFQFSLPFGNGATGTEAEVGTSAAAPNPLYEGAFDNAYENSANGSGSLYVCGNTGGAPTIYKIPITTNTMGTVLTGTTLTSATTPCSPLTDVSNPNATPNPNEWIFASAQNSGSGNNCAGGGCIMSLVIKPWQALTAYVVGQEVLDTNFQIQVVRTAGTSRAATPAWSTTLGATTADNTVRWLDQGPLAAFDATWVASHAYALNQEIVDSNGNIQLVTTAGNSKAGAHPFWNTTINGATNEGTGLVKWRNVGPIATASQAASGGTGGIIMDNVVGSGTLAGASQVYYSTQSNQACGTSGTGGCAVQASQSALQ